MVNILIKSKTKKESEITNVNEITYYSPVGLKLVDNILKGSDVSMNNWHGPVSFIGDTLLTIDRRDIESVEVK